MKGHVTGAKAKKDAKKPKSVKKSHRPTLKGHETGALVPKTIATPVKKVEKAKATAPKAFTKTTPVKATSKAK